MHDEIAYRAGEFNRVILKFPSVEKGLRPLADLMDGSHHQDQRQVLHTVCEGMSLRMTITEEIACLREAQDLRHSYYGEYLHLDRWGGSLTASTVRNNSISSSIIESQTLQPVHLTQLQYYFLDYNFLCYYSPVGLLDQIYMYNRQGCSETAIFILFQPTLTLTVLYMVGAKAAQKSDPSIGHHSYEPVSL